MKSKHLFLNSFISLFLSICPLKSTSHIVQETWGTDVGDGFYDSHNRLFCGQSPSGYSFPSHGEVPLYGSTPGRSMMASGYSSYDEVESSPGDWASCMPGTPFDDLSSLLSMNSSIWAKPQELFVQEAPPSLAFQTTQGGGIEHDEGSPQYQDEGFLPSPTPQESEKGHFRAESAPPVMMPYATPNESDSPHLGQEERRSNSVSFPLGQNFYVNPETGQAPVKEFSQGAPKSSGHLKRPRPLQGVPEGTFMTVLDFRVGQKKAKTKKRANKEKTEQSYAAVLKNAVEQMRSALANQEKDKKVLSLHSALNGLRIALGIRKKEDLPFLYETMLQGLSSLSMLSDILHEQRHYHKEASDWYEEALRELDVLPASMDLNMAFLHEKLAGMTQGLRTKVMLSRKALECYQKCEKKTALSQDEYKSMMQLCLTLQKSLVSEEEKLMHQQCAARYYEKIEKTTPLSAELYKEIFEIYDSLLAQSLGRSDATFGYAPAAFAGLRYLKATSGADPTLYAKTHRYFMAAMEHMQDRENKLILLKNGLFCFVEGINRQVYFDPRLYAQMGSSSLFLADQGVNPADKATYYRSAAALYETMVAKMGIEPNNDRFGSTFFNMAYANLQAGCISINSKEKVRHLDHAVNQFKAIIQASHSEERLAHIYLAIAHMHLSELVLDHRKAHLVLASSYFERGGIDEVTFPTALFEYAATCYFHLFHLEEEPPKKANLLSLASSYLAKDQNNGHLKTASAHLLQSKIALERSKLFSSADERVPELFDVARANARIAFDLAKKMAEEAMGVLEQVPPQRQ